MNSRLYKKLKSNSKHVDYTFVKNMEKGASDPILAKSTTSDSAYVIKGPSTEQTVFNKLLVLLFIDKRLVIPEALALAAFNSGSTYAPEDVVYNKHCGINDASDEFYMKKTFFTADLSRRLAKNCVSKYYNFFDCETDYTLIGSKFFTNYTDWSDICIDGKIDGYPIDENGYVVHPSGKKMPIKGLGLIALIAQSFIVADMHDDNWGVINCGDYYQAVIIDIDFSFDMFGKFKTFNNAMQCLQLFYKANDVTSCALPPQLINAHYIHQEFYDGINELTLMVKQTGENQEEYKELVEKYFKPFTFICDDFYEMSKKHIEQNIINATKEALVAFYTNEYKEPTALPHTANISEMYHVCHASFFSPEQLKDDKPKAKKQKLNDNDFSYRSGKTG